MPTENELKYVLSPTIHEDDDFVDMCSDSAFYKIRQGYLAFAKGMSIRIRESTQKNKITRRLTFKQKVNNRVVEIEKKMDERDFEDLWKVTLNRLEKIRYEFRYYSEFATDKYDCWEIDLFTHPEIYFALAEIEMPEGQLDPNFIPDVIQNNLLLAVPLDDDRFASKRLADVPYAKKIYQELIDATPKT